MATLQPFEYLESQPGITFQKLYQEPATALSIFRRMLPRLAQTVVMAMLFVDEPFLEPDLRVWFRAERRQERAKALSVLEKLHIMSRTKTADNVAGYQLLPAFTKSLRAALTGSGTSHPFGVFYEVGGGEFTLEFLDGFARSRWEAILYYIVGYVDGESLSGGQPIMPFTKKLLETGNYVKNVGGTPSITRHGFSLLLQEVNAQVWTLLIIYLETAQTHGLDSIDVLNFLFKLGSFHLGQAYSTAELTGSQKRMLNHLSDFGLIYRRAADSPFFHPTRLATTLASDSPALVSDSDMVTRAGAGVVAHDQPTSQQYIIVETNYRLYAYVTSPLQICILALFARMQMRFPNMVSGKLTKNSITRAFERGITADQIIVYLQRHAHPQMRKGFMVLPPTVVDQIKLWQIEGDQLEASHGYLLNQFSSQREYEEVKKYSQSIGVLVWSSDNKQSLFLSQLDQVRAYLANRQRQQQQAAGQSAAAR